MLSGINAVKFYLGMFMLVETVGVTLLEPLLVALPLRSFGTRSSTITWAATR